MKIVSSFLSLGFLVSAAALAGCDKDVDVGEPSDQTGNVASGGDAGSGPDSSSDSATSTSGSTPDGSETTPDSGASTGVAFEPSDYYFAETENRWPGFHLAVTQSSGELTYTLSTTSLNLETGEWADLGMEVIVQDVQLAEASLKLFTDQALLDGVPGILDLDMTLQNNVLCGTMAYGFGSAGDPLPAWGFKAGQGVDEEAMSACPGG